MSVVIPAVSCAVGSGWIPPSHVPVALVSPVPASILSAQPGREPATGSCGATRGQGPGSLVAERLGRLCHLPATRALLPASRPLSSAATKEAAPSETCVPKVLPWGIAGGSGVMLGYGAEPAGSPRPRPGDGWSGRAAVTSGEVQVLSVPASCGWVCAPDGTSCAGAALGAFWGPVSCPQGPAVPLPVLLIGVEAGPVGRQRCPHPAGARLSHGLLPDGGRWPGFLQFLLFL